MGKFRKISLILLMIGFVFSTNSCATQDRSGHRNNGEIKSTWFKSAKKKKPHHRGKAHHKKYKGQSKHSFLRWR